MTTTSLITATVTEAIHALWTEGGNRDDAHDAGANIFAWLEPKLILDAPDLRADTLAEIVAALPAGFPADFRLHLVEGFELAAFDAYGLADDDFNPFED
jgi:hypothetical protein